MSTMSAPAPGGAPGAIDISQTERIPFGRLVKVETRKMVDTRSGFWLLLITGILLVLAAGIALLVIALNDNFSMSLENAFTEVLLLPLSLLLPVFAIQVVTSEWSQRTALVSFTLEAHRARLLVAKLVAVGLLAIGAVVLAFVLGLLLTAAGGAVGGYTADFALDGEHVVATVAAQVLYFLMAFGIGMVVLNTPAAVAFFYVVALLLPMMVYSILFSFFGWAETLIPFIDLQFASAPFLYGWGDVDGQDALSLAVAVAIWVVAPMVIGFRRVMSTEPK